jgi:hypothetical protein
MLQPLGLTEIQVTKSIAIEECLMLEQIKVDSLYPLLKDAGPAVLVVVAMRASELYPYRAFRLVEVGDGYCLQAFPPPMSGCCDEGTTFARKRKLGVDFRSNAEGRKESSLNKGNRSWTTWNYASSCGCNESSLRQ